MKKITQCERVNPLYMGNPKTDTRVRKEMGKQNSRTFPGLFQDFFQELNFFPILYKTTAKNTFFQPEMSN